MNTSLLIGALVSSLTGVTVQSTAATFHVAPPPAGNDASPGTEAQPFATIERGLDAAGNGDTVVVGPGTYYEGIRFNGKNLTLRSTDPSDTNVVCQTAIHGGGSRVVVQFEGSETEACRIEGFTLTRGSLIGSDALGAAINGGSLNRRTRATIRNNRIIDNQETGIACCDGRVEGNTISHNTSWKSAGGVAYCDGEIRGNWVLDNRTFQGTAAGGLAWCNGRIEGNTIAGNVSDAMGASGGGLGHCHGVIRDNIIRDNRASGNAGGGLDHCDGTIEGNQIAFNSAVYGGGLAHCEGAVEGNIISTNSPTGIYRCDTAVRNNLVVGNQGHGLAECNGPIENNTICDNSGYGLYACQGPILNCIVWGNMDGGAEQLHGSSIPAYSCVQHWPGDGVGNLIFAPHFVDAVAGDYRLHPWSPCIDAGDPASDTSGEPEASGSRIDIGAYGNTPAASTPSVDADSDALPDAWEGKWFGDLGHGAADDPDMDGILNLAEYCYGWDPGAAAAVRVQNRTQGKWYQTIQSALGESVTGDQLVIELGLFRENVHFQGRNVSLRSTDPSDPAVVAGTIIEGFPSAAVVAFSGTEDEHCALEGLTLRHGNSADGSQAAWGICGGTADRHTKAKMHNNVITGNKAERGAGLIYCDGSLRGNIITNNTASAGGGLASCNGTIEANTIAHNQATVGGGLVECEAVIRGNVIAKNLGHGGGGGLLNCDGVILDNIIRDNWTEQDESSGGGLKDCDGWIGYNVIIGNRSRCDGGGGMAECSGSIVGNLIAANATDGVGGGLFNCEGLIQNNTVADNQAQGQGGGGLAYCVGTIQNCIVWANTSQGGPQLLECSLPTYSCIQGWTEGGEGCLAHDPRFTGQSAGGYRLRPSSPCIDAGEPGGSTLPERDLAGNHRVSYGGQRFAVDIGAYEFTLAQCATTSDGQRVVLTWSSRTDRSYTVSWSTDLEAWSQAVRVPSVGNSVTSWTDDGSLTGTAPTVAALRFYRIQEALP